MSKKYKYEGLPPVLQIYKEIDKVMRLFRRIPDDSRDEVASFFCFVMIAAASKWDSDHGKSIFGNAKSKFLNFLSK